MNESSPSLWQRPLGRPAIRPIVLYFLLPLVLCLAIVEAWLVTQGYGYDLADSGAFDTIAWQLQEGRQLYRDAQTVYTPGLHVLEEVIFRVAGPSVYHGKFIGLFTLLPTALLLYFLALRLSSPVLAVGAAVFPMALAPGYYPGHVFSLAALLLLGLGTGPWVAAGAGALIGLALLGKTEVGLAALVGGAALILFRHLSGARGPTEEVRGPRLCVNLGAYLAGFAVPVGLFVGCLALRGMLGDAWYFLYVAPSRWARVLSARSWPNPWTAGRGLPFGAALSKLSMNLDFYAGWLLAAGTLAIAARRLVLRRARETDALICGLAVFAAVLLPLGYTVRDVYHTFPARLVALPLEAFLLFWAIVGWRRGSRTVPRPPLAAGTAARRSGLAAIRATAGAAALLFLATIWLWRVPNYVNFAVYEVALGVPDPDAPARLADWRVPRIPRMGATRLPPGDAAALEEMVGMIEKRLAPGELFFAYPGAPGLYFLTGRTPPTRFLLFYPGMVDRPHQQEVIRALERHRIRLVVVNEPLDNPYLTGPSPRQDNPVLVEWIERRYAPAETIGPFRLYWRRQ